MPITARVKPRDQKETKKKRERRKLEAIRERVLQAVATLGDSHTMQAMELGVSRSTRDRWLKPGALPSVPHLLRIAERTGRSVAWMLGSDAADHGRSTTLSNWRTSKEGGRLGKADSDAGSDDSAAAVDELLESIDSGSFRSRVRSGVDRALRGIRASRAAFTSPEENSFPPWAERIRRALTGRSESVDTLCLRAVRAEVFDSGTKYRKAMLDLAVLMTVDSSRVFEDGLPERLRAKALDIRRFAETLWSFEAMVKVMPEMERVGPIVGALFRDTGMVVLESRFAAVAPSLGLVWRGKHRDYAWYLELPGDEAIPIGDARDQSDRTKPKLCAMVRKRGRFLTPRPGMSFIEQLAALTGDAGPLNDSLGQPEAPLPEAAALDEVVGAIGE